MCTLDHFLLPLLLSTLLCLLPSAYCLLSPPTAYCFRMEKGIDFSILTRGKRFGSSFSRSTIENELKSTTTNCGKRKNDEDEKNINDCWRLRGRL